MLLMSYTVTSSATHALPLSGDKTPHASFTEIDTFCVCDVTALAALHDVELAQTLLICLKTYHDAVKTCCHLQIRSRLNHGACLSAAVYQAACWQCERVGF